MGNLYLGKICPKCLEIQDRMGLKCAICGSELKDVVAKILTIDNKPIPENPEPEGRYVVYQSIEEIRDKIEYAMKKGMGRTRCTCGRDLKLGDMAYYPHEGGIPVAGKGRLWIFLHCRHCGYDWALWKLGYGIDQERESNLTKIRVAAENALPMKLPAQN